MKSCRT
jgi:hypothetical protein